LGGSVSQKGKFPCLILMPLVHFILADWFALIRSKSLSWLLQLQVPREEEARKLKQIPLFINKITVKTLKTECLALPSLPESSDTRANPKAMLHAKQSCPPLGHGPKVLMALKAQLELSLRLCLVGRYQGRWAKIDNEPGRCGSSPCAMVRTLPGQHHTQLQSNCFGCKRTVQASSPHKEPAL